MNFDDYDDVEPMQPTWDDLVRIGAIPDDEEPEPEDTLEDHEWD